jgi:hypothetical protein
MGTFSEYLKLRSDILDECTKLEELWVAATRRTEYESMAGAKTPESEIENLLAEVRKRLASDTVEVGIFGQVKRGKSTLINSLVGQRVSSTGIIPETAAPVWVESGPQRSVVLFADGHQETFEEASTGAEMATQRQKAKSNSHGDVVRVQQYLEVDWLPEGLRLVDTPGLSDPSLIQEYEDRTISELERVAAAVFVIVAPPGADREEVRLLKSLGKHGVDKAFIVCNFWSDIWNDPIEKEQVLRYIQETVLAGALSGDVTSNKEVRLYGLNAKLAFQATEIGDSDSYISSGVERLRQDIEEYLSSGALAVMTSSVATRLGEAREIVLSTLLNRKRLLQDPSLLENAKLERLHAVEQSKKEIELIERDIRVAGQSLKSKLVELISQPFDSSLSDLARSSTIDEAKRVEQSLQLRMDTAAGRVSHEFAVLTSKVIRDSEKRLYASFGEAGTFASPVAQNFQQALEGVSDLGTASLTKFNWESIAMTSIVAGAGTGLIGGSLAGGLGLALVLAGPVGWAIGAGAGLLIGMTGGAIAGGGLSYGKLKPGDREKIAKILNDSREKARNFVQSVASDWVNAAIMELNSRRSRYLMDKELELKRVEAVIADTSTRQDALKTIDTYITQIS